MLVSREIRVFVIVGFVVVGVALFSTAALMAPERQADVWVEIAKGAM